LLDAGARCNVPCRSQEELDRFPYGQDARVRIAKGVDLTDEAQVDSFYAQASGGSTGLWASIHAAGGFAMGSVGKTSKPDFERMMDMNALTCFLCCREAVARMGGGGGRIVNVSARPALEPRTGAKMVAYTAGKAAVAAMTEALAEEVVGQGILVNAVVPSVLDTPANRKAMPSADFARWPKVEQVAATIVFLASPQNTSTRGALVPVYGAA
jgi:NAD(P)-dependent dehydrogenase (short-subunit alcohol dehydrogenase family)